MPEDLEADVRWSFCLDKVFFLPALFLLLHYVTCIILIFIRGFFFIRIGSNYGLAIFIWAGSSVVVEARPPTITGRQTSA